MRYDFAPSSLSRLLVVAVVQKGGGEGARDREKDEPVAGWETETKIWDS